MTAPLRRPCRRPPAPWKSATAPCLWEGAAAEAQKSGRDAEGLLEPNDLRLWAMMSALRRNTSADELLGKTYVDPWFISAMQRIVNMERRLLGETLTPDLLYRAKRLGFSDVQVGTLADMLPEQVRDQRHRWGLRPVYKMVDTCAAEFEAVTPYYYSTYEQENEAPPLPGKKAVVIGSGPIRIGQGIEFDYCSVHAAWALSAAGVSSVMINSNPETVSTDFDTSDRLYFEALDEEAVRDVIDNETVDDDPAAVGGAVRRADGHQPVPGPGPRRAAHPGFQRRRH